MTIGIRIKLAGVTREEFDTVHDHINPDRTAPKSASSNSLKLLRQARERLGQGLRAVDADNVAESDGISLRNQ